MDDSRGENRLSGSLVIAFDFSKSGVNDVRLREADKGAAKAHEILSAERQNKTAGFWDLPFDQDLLFRVREAAAGIRSRFQNLLVIGIGGSSVGLKAISRALWPADAPMRLFIQESPDPSSVSKLLRVLDWKRTAVNIISKSGNTVETLALADVFIGALKERVGTNWREQVVVTTGANEGKLTRMVREEKLAHFAVPENVGGRFSVFSAVGLLPLACLQIDIRRLLKGAQAAVERCSDADCLRNPATRGGLTHFLLSREGKTIAVLMTYGDALRDFGLWFSQLWGESLGKEGKGQTPLACQGPQDQHSLAQLFLDGPRDKMVTLVRVRPEAGDPLGDLMEREFLATRDALAESGVPVITVILGDLNEESLGELMMSCQIQTAFTGHLFGVNPYDQPAVERIKRKI